MLKVNLDKVGFTASTVCAIHCLIMPFILALLPYIGMSFFASSSFEWFIVIISFLIASTSLCFGYKLHKKSNPLMLAGIGFSVIIATRLFVFLTDKEDFKAAIFLCVGGLFVAISHFVNHKLCQSCTKCNSCNGK